MYVCVYFVLFLTISEQTIARMITTDVEEK